MSHFSGLGSSGGAGTLLGQNTNLSHTGDLVETVLATIPIPAGTLGINGRIWAHTMWGRTNGGTPANATLQIRFGAAGSGTGGTACITNGSNVLGTGTMSSRLLLDIMNFGSASSQYIYPGSSYGGIVQTWITSSVDTASASEIALTGQLGNAGDTITLIGYSIIAFAHS